MPGFVGRISGNPRAAIGVALIILAGSLGVILKLVVPHSQAGPVDAYFYDVGSGELFTASNGNVPPIEAPSGKEGVKAHVFSCGDCGDPDQRFIAYLEKYTAEYKQKLREEQLVPASLQGESLLRGSPGGRQWYQAASRGSVRMMAAVRDRCGKQGKLTRCYP